MRIVLITYFFLSFVVSAQSELSLIQAIQIGLEENYGIQIADKRLRKARNSNTTGQAGLLPALSLNLNSNNSASTNDNPAAFLKGTSISNRMNPAINLEWTLFNGFRARITKNRLDALESELKGAVDILIENTIQSIILAYYVTLLERNRSDILKITLLKSKDLYHYSLSKKELGITGTADILNDQSAFLSDSINYINQVFNYRKILRSLNILLNSKDIDQEYILTDKLTIEPRQIHFETLKQEALDNNSDLKKEYLKLKVLDYDHALAMSSRSPRINLSTGYDFNLNRQDLSNAKFADGRSGPGQAIISSNSIIAANLTFNFKLFDGGKIKNAIKNAVLDQEIQQLTIEDMKRTITRNVTENFDIYNSRRAVKRLSTESIKVAKLNLDINSERYRQGIINSFEYSALQLTYRNAALTDLSATYNLISSYISLMRISGEIISYRE